LVASTTALRLRRKLHRQERAQRKAKHCATDGSKHDYTSIKERDSAIVASMGQSHPDRPRKAEFARADV
jgi:hypothetical protein